MTDVNWLRGRGVYILREKLARSIDSDLQKYFLTLTPNHPIIAPSRPTRGAYRDRRFARDGMRWTQWRRRARYACGRAAPMRTAKSCGPDAPRLASSSRKAKAFRGRWWHSMAARESTYKPSSHCAGKAGVFPLNLYARVRIFLMHNCTRDRGCSAHPVFPAPFVFRAELICKPRTKPCRESADLCLLVIARSEATKQSSLRLWLLDCFASLAMTATA